MSHFWEETVQRSVDGPHFVEDLSESYAESLARFNREIAALPKREPKSLTARDLGYIEYMNRTSGIDQS